MEIIRNPDGSLVVPIPEVRQHPPPKGGLKVTLRVAPEGWTVPRDSFFQNNFFLLPKLVETVRERMVDSGNRFLAAMSVRTPISAAVAASASSG